MQRDLKAISGKEFDVLIVGGGIYGAWAAWDASRRGLSVALVDKGDFGGATSSNSLKIIHGGLRYLQHADFKRMRESIYERKVLMRVAPHLVHPLPVLMPTYGHGLKGPEVMGVALLMNDLVSVDRNRGNDPQKRLPNGRIVSRAEVRRLFPGVEEDGLSGGAVWYDAQVYNSERLLMSVLRSAEQAGTVMANYVEMTGFLKHDSGIAGVQAHDQLSGHEIDVRARLTINNAGPWADHVLDRLNGYAPKKRMKWSKAFNLVAKRQLVPDYAVGFPSKVEFVDKDRLASTGSRLLFMAPWREFTLLGTVHLPYEGDPGEFEVTEAELTDFLKEVNDAYAPAKLERSDISFVYGGLLPMDDDPDAADVRLVKQYRLVDHANDSGLDGLVTAVGVKYTTARDVASKTIDLASKKLGAGKRSSETHELPVFGGEIARFDDFLANARDSHGDLGREAVDHLAFNYGSEYERVLSVAKDDASLAEPVAPDARVLRAEVLHGIREEMAQRLSDVVFRRTDLGSAGYPGDDAVQACAEIMAGELGWDEARTREEVDAVRGQYSDAAQVVDSVADNESAVADPTRLSQ